MMTFRDMTYCSSDCATYTCERNKQAEAKDRKHLTALAFLPSAWANFSKYCGQYQPIKQEEPENQ